MPTAARASADVGLIGLAVMGENLALNGSSYFAICSGSLTRNGR